MWDVGYLCTPKTGAESYLVGSSRIRSERTDRTGQRYSGPTVLGNV